MATFTDLILRVVLALVLSCTALKSTGVWYAWPIGWTVAAVMSIMFYKRKIANTVKWQRARFTRPSLLAYLLFCHSFAIELFNLNSLSHIKKIMQYKYKIKPYKSVLYKKRMNFITSLISNGVIFCAQRRFITCIFTFKFYYAKIIFANCNSKLQ